MIGFLLFCVIVFGLGKLLQTAAKNPGPTIQLAKWAKGLMGK